MKIRVKYILIPLIVFISINNFASAQQDSIKADTTRFYKNIEKNSNKTKVGTVMYHWVFKQAPVNPQKAVQKKGYKKLIQKPYSTFEGKIVRNINIVTLDPFGYSLTDTSVIPKNFFFKSGNALHIKSQRITIRNLLLFRKNRPFHSLEVKESERLIRSQSYVNDVFFYVKSSGTKPDSVDILIRVLDKWSIRPEAGFSTKDFNVSITDNNLAGLGHVAKNAYSKNDTSGINAFNSTYTIPNIKNTYISTILHYEIEGNKNFDRSIDINRPFYSPLAKWAGGVRFGSQYKNDSIKNAALVMAPIEFKFRTEDYWAGYAHRIFETSNVDDRITNLTLAVRYFHLHYTEKPSLFSDPSIFYSNENFYLGSIGISTRKYVLDKYIFKFGLVEDVPVGLVYELTGGYQIRNNTGRLYVGMRVSFGDYYKWGYLSSSAEYGTFLRASHAEEGVITVGLNYFTGLIEIGKWKFREFIKPQITIGLNQPAYDSITLNNGYGLDGFNSTTLSGTKRMLLTMQTQSYSPWHVAGFHFGPFFICSFGMLGDPVNSFKTSKVYYQLGLGVLIKNENLNFNTFQLSISFFPIIPGNGYNIFKTNSLKTYDFGFRDFETGKPKQVTFR
jgi:hypothetical protein